MIYCFLVGAPVSKAGMDFPLELVIGRITSVTQHEGAPHLLVVQVDVGTEVHKQIVANVKPHYTTETLTNKLVVVLTNLKPSNFKSVRSEGMLLTAVSGSSLSVLTVSDSAGVVPGTVVSPVGFSYVSKKNMDVKAELKKADLQSREGGIIYFGDAPLQAAGKNCIAETGAGAKVQ